MDDLLFANSAGLLQFGEYPMCARVIVGLTGNATGRCPSFGRALLLQHRVARECERNANRICTESSPSKRLFMSAAKRNLARVGPTHLGRCDRRQLRLGAVALSSCVLSRHRLTWNETTTPPDIAGYNDPRRRVRRLCVGSRRQAIERELSAALYRHNSERSAKYVPRTSDREANVDHKTAFASVQ